MNHVEIINKYIYNQRNQLFIRLNSLEFQKCKQIVQALCTGVIHGRGRFKRASNVACTLHVLKCLNMENLLAMLMLHFEISLVLFVIAHAHAHAQYRISISYRKIAYSWYQSTLRYYAAAKIHRCPDHRQLGSTECSFENFKKIFHRWR